MRLRRVTHAALLAAALLLAALATGCAKPLAWAPSSASPATTLPATRAPEAVHPSATVIPTSGAFMIGAYESGLPVSFSRYTTFAQATGVRPKIDVYYSGWGEGFHGAMARTIWSNGAYPLIQLQPDGISLADIASGDYDGYLRQYARGVEAFGHPVIISFAHEMNGDWYSWGATHVSPAVYIAAWRHLVTVFRQSGADNVTWLWAVNGYGGPGTEIAPWYPGDKYVDWVGIDGYFAVPSDTFDSVFATSVSEIRQLTTKPILIAETGVGPQSSRLAQIQSLFAGVQKYHMIGFVWFDEKQDSGLYHQDWRLEDSSSALAEFRHEALSLTKS
jgi:hypothetical protein